LRKANDDAEKTSFYFYKTFLTCFRSHGILRSLGAFAAIAFTPL
jgi:hypothetical protein